MLLRMRCFVYFSSGRNFIRDVVLRLLSRGTNFHSSKHMRNYTQYGDSLTAGIHAHVVCFCFPLLSCKRNY